ncbi:hypothetical protein [Collimonas sp.]|uniref:hypothetical protein n=1 Tax=Collimonas sp. TaxID=1963772 RepID=UPI002C7520A0|nr:hypothetical protein [Collimonas sp.]HWW99626.1 hypothetical protein [Collimonas sp.]
MSEPITSIAGIIQHAHEAAEQGRLASACRYPVHSEAAERWHAAYHARRKELLEMAAA